MAAQPSTPVESAAGEEDPGAALDIAETTADEASGLIEAPMAPGSTPAKKESHNFPDGGGSGGAEAYRVKKDLRGNSHKLDE